jgi:anti-anti-sigma regulatory factor
MGFDCSLMKRGEVVVASLSGVLDRAAAPALTNFQNDLLALSPRAVVFDMKNLQDVKSESFRCFALLAKGLKDTKVHYCYSTLRSPLKRDLIGAGLISHCEAVDSLELALKALFTKIEVQTT